MRTSLVVLFAAALIAIGLEPIPVAVTASIAVVAGLLLMLTSDYGRKPCALAPVAAAPSRPEKLRLAA